MHYRIPAFKLSIDCKALFVGMDYVVHQAGLRGIRLLIAFGRAWQILPTWGHGGILVPPFTCESVILSWQTLTVIFTQ
jgi:hypothetical protein